ncbi:GMC oxidoreductase [Streptomyces sp. NPDC058989]|uniref:GMC oxidoreductase n=1 Tax=Streptomyces sp. NPDC058989 TaxID=3346686 RepID=UPI00368C602C
MSGQSHPAAPQSAAPRSMSEAAFRALYGRLREQARKGPDQRRGALGRLTPEHVVAAAAEVRCGRTVSLAAPIETRPGPDNPQPASHRMTVPAYDGEGEPRGLWFALDRFAMNVHGDADSHLDALCHVVFDGELHGGVPASSVTPDGARALTLDLVRDGIVGRGVLLDVPRLRGPDVEMITRARVTRLETDPTGRSVTAVVTQLPDGEQVRFSADIVVVACGAVNSAALLLASANDRHPRGLANSSDVVGRHYMRHNNLALMAVSHQPNDTQFQKTLALHDWYLGADDWDYPLGGIQMLGKSDAEQIHGEAPRWAGEAAPDMPFEVLAHHAVDFWLCGEDLPQPDNRVTLDGDGRIHLTLDENNNITALKRLRHEFEHLLGHLGMHEHRLLSHSIYLHKGMPIGATAHQAGTVRFGDDPASSALDVNCKAHDLDNLYVVDTSFFPSIGAVNPSLTAMANALRVGDHLMARLG